MLGLEVYGGFLKWWYPTTMGFPTKNDRFGGTTNLLYVLVDAVTGL